MKTRLWLAVLLGLLFVLDMSSMAGNNDSEYGTGKTKVQRKAKNKNKNKNKNRNKSTKNRANKNKSTRAQKQQERQARKKAKNEEAKEKQQEAAESKLTDRLENKVDKRQANQENRINHGIKRGYLTESEIQTLTEQQNKISQLEATYKSDGKLTRDEAKSLKQELQTASANIWASKHDTEGNQMAVYRFGKNVFAKESLTSTLENPNLTGTEARKLTADFRKIMELKKMLSTEKLSDSDRSSLQDQYDTLLNEYFEVH